MNCAIQIKWNILEKYLTAGEDAFILLMRDASKYLTLIFYFTVANAQDRPFLFTIVPQEVLNQSAVLHYDLAYGGETFEPFGSDNIEQTFGVQTRLNELVSLVGRLSLASDKLSNNSSQQVEFLAEVLNSEDKVFDLSVGPGFLHEYAGTNDLLGRAIIGRCFSSWKIYGNVLVEKAFAKNRDEFDLFLTAGLSYKVSSSFHLGFEAVGQDLEGIWDATEAEGGATVFIGPTITAAIPTTQWIFNIGAGPIIRATHSIQTSFAARDIPIPGKNGFMVRAVINFGL